MQAAVKRASAVINNPPRVLMLAAKVVKLGWERGESYLPPNAEQRRF